MRTAVTLGVTHGGEEVLIHGRSVPVHEQKQKFNELLGVATDPDYSEVNYQESDDGHGNVRVIRFAKPEAAAAPQKNETKPNSKKK